MLSALVLREPTGPWRWGAVAMGFAGVLLIAQPWGDELPLLGAAIALGAAMMIALISVQLRDLGRTEHPFTIVFYFSLFSVPVLGLAMPFVAKAHPPQDWLLLLACGVIGVLGQVLLTAALRYGTVANVIVMDYSGLIWATLFGWLVFANLPGASFWFGAPLVGAGLLIAWREHTAGHGAQGGWRNRSRYNPLNLAHPAPGALWEGQDDDQEDPARPRHHLDDADRRRLQHRSRRRRDDLQSAANTVDDAT